LSGLDFTIPRINYTTYMVIGAVLILQNAAIMMEETYFAHVCVTLQDVEAGLMRSVVVNVMTTPGTASEPYACSQIF